MSAPTCPRCGCRFDVARHRWKRAAAMAGRIAGWQWTHERPDNGKACTYVDAGALRGYAGAGGGGRLGAPDEERDAPDEARMAG